VEFAGQPAARSWTLGDGPKAIFLDGVAWLRERKILLPGVTTLARLVAKVRDDTTRRLWRELEGLLTPVQRHVLDRLLDVPPGSRVSDLERWRKGPVPRGSGPAIIKALDQVSEIKALGLAELGAEALVPPRRLGELARYGMSADAGLIRRHPDGRRLATLLATVRHLEAKSVDDALELLDLLMTAETAEQGADRIGQGQSTQAPPARQGVGPAGGGGGGVVRVRRMGRSGRGAAGVAGVGGDRGGRLARR
jgi:hypothetical protein